MGSLQKVCLCLLLTAILALKANGQRNRYNYNNNNNNNNNNYNNQNSGYRGSSVCDDRDNPCEEGRPIDIPCPAQFSGQSDNVVSCIWKHVIPSSSNSGFSTTRHVTCGANGCKAASGDVDQTYLNDRSVSYSMSPCSLRIERAHPDDSAVGNTGEWECHLQTDDAVSGIVSSMGVVDVFISNVTEIQITDPANGDDIQYDLSRTSRGIEATCTGWGGLPDPTFHWYIDDDDNSNEITDGEASFDVNTYEDKLGRRVEHTISFSPDLQTLCDLNLDEACDIINGDEDFNGLNFNLICKAEQAIGQYQDENNRQKASVMVEVSSARSLTALVNLIPLLWIGLRVFS